MIIDKSGIPADKWRHPDHAECEADLGRQLSDSHRRNEICIHEACHFLYLQKVGAVAPVLCGPRISYNPETDQMEGACASVCAPELKGKGLPPLSAALVSAAGGIAVEVLTGSPRKGNETDLKKFLTAGEGKKTESELRELWDKAETRIRSDLSDLEFQNKIRALAEKFETQLVREGKWDALLPLKG